MVSGAEHVMGRGVLGELAGDLPAEAGFRIQSHAAHFQPFTGLADVGDYRFSHGAVLALATIAVGSIHVWGSAAMLAPGLAVSAWHVYEEFSERGHFSGSEHGLFVFGICGARIEAWEVTHLIAPEECDVTILYLRPRGFVWGGTINVFSATTKLPKIGETINILGFRSSEESFPMVDRNFTVSMNLLSTSGQISEIYPKGRDRVLLPGACIEVEAPAIGGMSGGPAFNNEGNLVGIVSSSLAGDESSDGPLYISLLWPVLVREVQPSWPPKFYGKQQRLFELPLGLYLIGRNRLSITQDAAGNDASWEYADYPGP